MKKLAILGASGHGKVVADTAELLGYEVVFFDDAWPLLEANGHWPVVGDTARLLSLVCEFSGAAVAIGNNRIRLDKLNLLGDTGFDLPVLVHPQACVSRYAVLGSGTVVFAGAAVNADAQVGSGVILNTGCTVDHDCVLGDAVHVSPGANLAGGVQVGARSWIGIGSSVRQLVCVGTDVVVGAGAVVVKNVVGPATVVGVPAGLFCVDKTNPPL